MAYGDEKWWRNKARENRAGLGELGERNLARLLAAAGVSSPDDLPPRQASALTWLASYEADTVEAITAALTRNGLDGHE